MNFAEIKKKYFKSTEEIVSMFLGLVIVVVVGGLIFNYFQKSKGTVDIPGSNSEITLTNNGEKLTANGEKIYKVKKGDSLWKIAQAEYNDGYSWTKIAEVNNLKNPSVLETDQELILPKLEVKETVAKVSDEKETTIAVGSEYKVVKNDNLWTIAVRAYGDGYQWTKIWQENRSKLNTPDGLEIGMMLTIPNLN